jgi:ElaB/YqjD/DUF883 family membrane-anchored ribosome-binding protein
VSEDWSGLGWNPTPGHPRLATNLANHLAGTAEVLKETHGLLDSLHKESSHWRGDARNVFVEKISDLPKYLADAKDSLHSAGKEIQSWSDDLEEMKSKAAGHENDAKKARKRVAAEEKKYESARNNPDLRLAGQRFSTQPELDDAQRRLDLANGEVQSAWNRLDTAQTELQDLIDAAETLERNHSDTAQSHADQIRKHAADYAPESGWLDGLSDWWDKHGGDLLTVAATVAGIAAIFIPVLAPVAIGLSLAAAAQHTYQYSKSGKDMWPPTSSNLGEWATVGGDLLGAVPGVGPAVRGVRAGIAATRGANGARLGVTGGSRAIQAMKSGATHFKEYAKAVDPSNPLFSKPIGWATRALGGSDAAAVMASDVTQAVATGGLAAPTAATLWDSSDSTANAAKWGTVINDGVVAGGMAPGPLGKIGAIAKAL